jgi:hypothetical protein
MHYSSSSTMAAIHAVPGKVMGIWAFAVSFVVPVVGLVLGIVALAQSRRAGVPNNWAQAAIAVSIAVLVAAGITSIAIWG